MPHDGGDLPSRLEIAMLDPLMQSALDAYGGLALWHNLIFRIRVPPRKSGKCAIPPFWY